MVAIVETGHESERQPGSETERTGRLDWPGDDAVGLVRSLRRRLEGLAPVDRAAALQLRRELNLLAAEGARLCVRADATAQATAGRTTLGRARREAAIGQAMDRSDAVRDAVRQGDVSIDAVEQLGRHAELPGYDDALPGLLESAANDTCGEFQRKLQSFAAGSPEQAETERQRRWRMRSLKSWIDPDTGMQVGRWDLDQLEHDAVWKVVRRVANRSGDDGRSTVQRDADALVEIVRAYAASELTIGRDTAHVFAHIDADTLERRAQELGFTDLGAIVTPADVQRYAQVGLVSAYLTRNGVPLAVFEGRRLASPEQYRVLVATAGSCEVGYCDRPGSACQAHHVVAWVWNPVTRMWELALFCEPHHTQAHLEKWQAWRDARGLLHIHQPDGTHVTTTRSRHAAPVLSTHDPPPWGTLPPPTDLAASDD